MKSRIIPILVILAALLSPLQGMAFNDERPGFVFGLGGGMGSAGWSYVNDSRSSSGLATSLKIGGGLSDQLMLYYSNRVIFFSIQGNQFAQGMSALGLSYFLSPEAPSFFVSGEVGMGAVTLLEDYGGADSGIGMTLGVGYTLSPHMVLEANYMSASVGEDVSDFRISNFTVTLGWLGF